MSRHWPSPPQRQRSDWHRSPQPTSACSRAPAMSKSLLLPEPRRNRQPNSSSHSAEMWALCCSTTDHYSALTAGKPLTPPQARGRRASRDRFTFPDSAHTRPQHANPATNPPGMQANYVTAPPQARSPTGRAAAAIMATLADFELELGQERRAVSRESPPSPSAAGHYRWSYSPTIEIWCATREERQLQVNATSHPLKNEV